MGATSGVSAPEEERALRIGELAERVGTTPRTIRYYEEIGLLPSAEDRGQGKHRLYGEDDVQRLRDVLRLRDLLGLSLRDLARLVEAEAERAVLRREWERSRTTEERRRVLETALANVDERLEVLEARRDELERTIEELRAKRERVRGRLAELGADPVPA
jgi:DNA-binding transcriptional MerR regulator